jgi:hypothetical protein
VLLLGCVFALASSALAADLTVQKWHGNGIDYSGYRAGQNPQLNRFPTQAQILEDLKILEKNWKLIRLYGGDQHSLGRAGSHPAREDRAQGAARHLAGRQAWPRRKKRAQTATGSAWPMSTRTSCWRSASATRSWFPGPTTS